MFNKSKLINIAINSKNDLDALCAAVQVMDNEELLKKIVDQSRHDSVRRFAIKNIMDINYLRYFAAATDNPFSDVVTRRIQEIQKRGGRAEAL